MPLNWYSVVTGKISRTELAASALLKGMRPLAITLSDFCLAPQIEVSCDEHLKMTKRRFLRLVQNLAADECRRRLLVMQVVRKIRC